MLVVESAKRSSSRDVYQALARLCQKIEDDSAYSTPHWTPSLQEHCAACLNGFVDCQCLGHEDLLKMVRTPAEHVLAAHWQFVVIFNSHLDIGTPFLSHIVCDIQKDFTDCCCPTGTLEACP